jgi:hypothetical protein
MKKRYYSNSTLSSVFVGMIGYLEVIVSVIVILIGIAIMRGENPGLDMPELYMLLGDAVGFVILLFGGTLMFNGALFICVSQSVGFSKQNNEMMKELLNMQVDQYSSHK